MRCETLAGIFVGFALLARAPSGWSSDDVLLRPQSFEPQDAQVKTWIEGCKVKGVLKSCYNVGVFYAQTKGDEPKALEYLRPVCQKGYGLGCFNVGGILIKDKATRREGLAAFKKACALSRASAGTEEANLATAEACSIADTVEKYQDSDYQPLAAKLGLLSAKASFDCAKAASAVEKMICLDDQTAALDARLADVYHLAIQHSAQSNQLKAQQKSWLTGERNKCANIECLQKAYRERLASLDAALAQGTPSESAPSTDAQMPGSFVHPPFVKPEVIEQLTDSLSSDERAPARQVVAIDLSDSASVGQHFGPAKTKENRTTNNPCVYYQSKPDVPDDPPPEFGYAFVGRTASGVDVLLTTESGGGSGRFESLLLVSVESEGQGKKRLLLKRVRQVDLGDRWDGALKVVGNEILIGKNTGQLAAQEPSSRRVIKVTYKR